MSTAIHTRSHELDCTRDTLAASLQIRAGLPVDEQLAARAEQYRGHSLAEIAREAVRLAGGQPSNNWPTTVRAAISGGTLAEIFSNTINQIVLTAFRDAEDSTEGWCREVMVPNFQTNKRHQMSQASNLEALPSGSAAEHASLSAETEQYKIKRYARQIVIDEQEIVDNNFSALTLLPAALAGAARRQRPNLVYEILLANASLDTDSLALFHASHGNVSTSAALDADNLDAAVATMGTLQQDGVTLTIRAWALVVPEALRGTAARLVHDLETRRSPTGLIVRSDGRLDNGMINPSGGAPLTGSATTWYLAARGGQCFVEVGFRGTKEPVVKVYQFDQDGQFGVGVSVLHDVGAKAVNFRGVHRASVDCS